MNFISNHKFTTFTIIMLLVIIILGVSLVRFLIPNTNLDEYGSRLKNIEKYKIEENKINELKDTISKNDGVVSVNYLLTGRLIDITIVVKDDVERDISKGYAGKVLDYFTEEQKGYYDIQVLIKPENDGSEKYPVMGYKHKSSLTFVWSNN